MNWMIYPAARAFIKVCAVLFGAGAAAAVLIHLFMPFFLRSPRTAAPFLLLGTGAEFIQCTGVKSAKQVYGEKCPELIILDVNLPDGSGYDYLKWVRSQADTPVLMLTANDMEMDEVMGLGLGADDYMTKPFSLAVLRARIRVLLRRRQQRQTDRFFVDGFLFDFGGLVFEKIGRASCRERVFRAV